MKLKTFKTIVFGIGATLLLCSCQKDFRYMRSGDSIRFTAGSGFSQTKAAYSGETNSAGTIERIDWQAGDLMRIYCAQASEPDVHYADYRVKSVDTPTSGSAVSTAHIETFSEATGGVGLRWGEGDHMFYAVFPSPEDNGITLSMGISPYADGGTKSSVSKSISGATVTAKLPATQKVVSVTGSGTLNCVAAPDLNNMLMTAKNGPFTPDTFPGENTVFLAFTPLTTAVQFTIKNQTKADLTLKSVSLTSAASALNGPFTVDIDDETHQPSSINLGGTTVSYAHSYPYCQYTGSVTAATKTVTINFASPITLAYDANIANCGSLTFTFFLQPCQNFDDLTFKLVKSDNSWMSTKLGYTDGTGIFFPRFKKTEVNGVFVPEGAQWTVKYTPDVVSWNAGGNTPINPMPEVNEDITLVTSWDTGVEKDLELTPVTPPDVLPEAFSVSSVHKVYFSSANLYFDFPENKGKFEDNQYDYRTYEGKNSCINGVVTTNGTPSGHWGLFGWSCEGVHYGTSVSTTNSNYSGEFLNWGKIFGTSDWRTLSKDEWYYMLFTRTVNGGTGEGKSYKQTTVTLENAATVKGFMIAPDSYTSDLTATYTWEAYQAAESAGCMFLPFAGVREGENVSSSGNMCFYWSSDRHDENTAYAIVFESAPGIGADVYLYRGCSVRLVKDAN